MDSFSLKKQVIKTIFGLFILSRFQVEKLQQEILFVSSSIQRRSPAIILHLSPEFILS